VNATHAPSPKVFVAALRQLLRQPMAELGWTSPTTMTFVAPRTPLPSARREWWVLLLQPDRWGHFPLDGGRFFARLGLALDPKGDSAAVDELAWLAGPGSGRSRMVEAATQALSRMPLLTPELLASVPAHERRHILERRTPPSADFPDDFYAGMQLPYWDEEDAASWATAIRTAVPQALGRIANARWESGALIHSLT
jgi:hypothetical protein